MAEFTDEDRTLIRRIHDSLLGTLEHPGGLIGKVGDLADQVEDVASELRGHTEWNHDDPHEVAKGAATVAVQLHEQRARHVAEQRSSPWSRMAWSVTEKVVTAGAVVVIGWAVGVWVLGLRVSLASAGAQ